MRRLAHGIASVTSALRLGWRQAVRRPGETALAVTALGIGVGLAAAALAILWRTYLQPPPFPTADRLVSVGLSKADDEARDVPSRDMPYATFVALREGALPQGLEQIGAWLPLNFNVSGLDGPPQALNGAQVSASLLSMSGMEPRLGRFFRADEEREGARLVVVSDEVAREHLGMSPGDDGASILGRSIEIQHEPHSIVGIMPAGFTFPYSQEMWTPLRPDHARNSSWMQVLGTTTERPTRASLGFLEELLEMRVAASATAPDRHVRLAPIQSAYHGRSLRTGVHAASAAAGLLLLLACANVTHLLLARGLRRQREMAVRASLGARRHHLVAQLVAETGILALAGGAVGLGLARLGIHLYQGADRGSVPPWVEVRLDTAVVLGTLALALLATMLAGVLPAWRTSFAEPRLQMAGQGAPRSHLHHVLVVAQVAGAMALLACTALLVQTLDDATAGERGLWRDDVITALLSQYRTVPGDDPWPIYRQRWHEVQDRLVALPQVASAALTSGEPHLHDGWPWRMAIDGRPDTVHVVRNHVVSPGSFETLDLALLAGRDFVRLAETTSPPRAPEVIIDATFADRFGGPREALGRRIRPVAENGSARDGDWMTVVGVVDAIPVSALDGSDGPSPRMYQSIEQLILPSAEVVVRLRPGLTLSADLERSMAEAAATVIPNAAMRQFYSLEDRLRKRLGARPLARNAFGVFGSVALSLTCVGLYGVLAMAVASRRRELAVRTALGATTGQLMRSVVAQGLGLVACGVACGALVAGWLTGILGSLTVDARPFDARSLFVAALVLLTAGVLASASPALRAGRVDPADALRDE